PSKDIHLYINSPGGDVNAGLGIYDVMRYVRPNVETISGGQPASMAPILLPAGTHGKRYALPHSRVLIHQPLGGVQGQASDIQIHAEEILKIRHQMNEILAEHTGREVSEVAKDTERDHFLSAEEALNYGIVDRVMVRVPHVHDDGKLGSVES